MRKSIIFDHERVSAWVAEKTGASAGWGSASSLGLAEGNELVAGVVFNNYVKDGRCSMHCAGLGKYWLNRMFLWMCFDYVFNQLNCNVILNSVDADNEASIRFTSHIGFTQIARVEGGAGDCDLLLFKMLRKDCKWLTMKVPK